jgi:hypothetical protein
MERRDRPTKILRVLTAILTTALPFLFLLGICGSYFLYLVSGSEKERQ